MIDAELVDESVRLAVFDDDTLAVSVKTFVLVAVGVPLLHLLASCERDTVSVTVAEIGFGTVFNAVTDSVDVEIALNVIVVDEDIEPLPDTDGEREVSKNGESVSEGFTVVEAVLLDCGVFETLLIEVSVLDRTALPVRDRVNDILVDIVGEVRVELLREGRPPEAVPPRLLLTEPEIVSEADPDDETDAEEDAEFDAQLVAVLSCALEVLDTFGLEVPVYKLVRDLVPTPPLDVLDPTGNDRVTVPLIELVICDDKDDTKRGLADALNESYITDDDGEEESLEERVSTPGVACK